MNKTTNGQTMRCDYFNISRKQRRDEDKFAPDRTGTQGYENQGCYDCNGLNDSCDLFGFYIKGNDVTGTKAIIDGSFIRKNLEGSLWNIKII